MIWNKKIFNVCRSIKGNNHFIPIYFFLNNCWSAKYLSGCIYKIHVFTVKTALLKASHLLVCLFPLSLWCGEVLRFRKKNNTIQQDLETNYQNTVLNKHIPTALSCAFTEISGLRGCNYHVLHTSAALFSTWSSFFSCQRDELPIFFFSPTNIAFSTEAESRKWKRWNTTSNF